MIGVVTVEVIPGQANWRDGDQRLEWQGNIDGVKPGDVFLDHEGVFWQVTAVKAAD